MRDSPAPPPDAPPPATELDLTTIVTTFSEMSGEIVLAALVEKLMCIAVRHAGADRGRLILQRTDGRVVVAGAVVEDGETRISSEPRAVTGDDVPVSVIDHVARTRAPVILSGAELPCPFAADPYLRELHPPSVLCLPLERRGVVTGVLYLENTRTCAAFTPARVSVLSMLALQMAISLENAALYLQLTTEIEDRRRVEEQLRVSEAFLAQGQRISHTGNWAWDIATGRTTVSAEHCRIFGIDPDRRVHSFEDVYQRIDPRDRDRWRESVYAAVRARAGFEHGGRIRTPDGATKHFFSAGVPAFDEAGELRGYAGICMDVTERKRAERALRRARMRVVRARYDAILDERTRLAREIHDTLLQGFTGVALQLAAAARHMEPREGKPDTLAGVIDLANRTLREARQAIWNMRSPPGTNDDSFLPLLREVLDAAVRGSGVEIRYHVAGLPAALPVDDTNTALRILREAVANAVKHARARTIRVQVSFAPRHVRFTVADDGRGFQVAPDPREDEGHWGLVGMRERAREIRARLSIRSAPGRGTRVRLRMPVAAGES